MEEKLHRRWVKIGGKKGSIFNGNLHHTSAIPESCLFWAWFFSCWIAWASLPWFLLMLKIEFSCIWDPSITPLTFQGWWKQRVCAEPLGAYDISDLPIHLPLLFHMMCINGSCRWKGHTFLFHILDIDTPCNHSETFDNFGTSPHFLLLPGEVNPCSLFGILPMCYKWKGLRLLWLLL